MHSLILLFSGFLVFGSLVFPRAYGSERAVLLGCLLVLLAFDFLNRNVKLKLNAVFVFFSAFIFVNFAAAIVGVIRGNEPTAIYDGLRIGVIFPIIIVFLYNHLSYFKYEKFLELVFYFSSAAIALLIVVAVFRGYDIGGFFSESFYSEMLLEAGIHEGYVQVIAHCVGSLFFLFGFFFYRFCDRQGFSGSIRLFFVLLIIALSALISGRRALQYAVLGAPVFVFLTALLTNSSLVSFKRSLSAWLLMAVFAVPFLLYLLISGYFDFEGFVVRILGSFHDDGGARSEQALSLFQGFLSYPIFGSGFGGLASVVRSDDSPWIFELIYLQWLYNFGFIGLLFLLLPLLIFGFKAISNARKGLSMCSGFDSALLNGALTLIFGSATNPYLGSFDFLLFFGALPFALRNTLGCRFTRTDEDIDSVKKKEFIGQAPNR